MNNPVNTVRANPPITQSVSKPTVIRVGVTKPKIPYGAKEIMKLVRLKITAFKLSQKVVWEIFNLSDSRETKKPKSKLKKIKPSNWPSTAALNRFVGTIR